MKDFLQATVCYIAAAISQLQQPLRMFDGIPRQRNECVFQLFIYLFLHEHYCVFIISRSQTVGKSLRD